MASVRKKSQAQQNLEYALGEEKTKFSDLFPSEQYDLLDSALQGVDLRELRGFKPLRELLVFRPSSFIYGREAPHTLDVEILELREGTDFSNGFISVSEKLVEVESDLSLNTHAIILSPHWLRNNVTFKQCETGNETTDYDVASSWGQSAYHYSGTAEVLVLRRPRNHTCASQNLFVIKFWYEKVPFERNHLIMRLEVVMGSFDQSRQRLGPMLHQHFGSMYAKVVVQLVCELCVAYTRTLDDLARQSRLLRGKAAELNRLSGAIMS